MSALEMLACESQVKNRLGRRSDGATGASLRPASSPALLPREEMRAPSRVTRTISFRPASWIGR